MLAVEGPYIKLFEPANESPWYILKAMWTFASWQFSVPWSALTTRGQPRYNQPCSIMGWQYSSSYVATCNTFNTLQVITQNHHRVMVSWREFQPQNFSWKSEIKMVWLIHIATGFLLEKTKLMSPLLQPATKIATHPSMQPWMQNPYWLSLS